MSTTYRIPDEPSPGRWQHLAVNPTWPLLAIMLAGTWLSWPWFIVNSIAIGSPTRRREMAIAAVGLVGTVLMAALLIVLVNREVIESELSIRLGLLILVVWKLGISYNVFLIQSRTFHIYEYYEGTVRSGLALLLVGAFVLRPLVIGASESILWKLVVSIYAFGGIG